MKKIASILLSIFCFVMSYSQTTTYRYVCGEKSAIIIWERKSEGGSIHFKTTQGKEIQEYVLNADYVTLSWIYRNDANNTDLTATKAGNNFHISGTLEGKPYSKIHKSKGVPWYQNIGFNVGYSMTGKQNYKFECFRPDNMKFYEMQADTKGTETTDCITVQRINVHLTGALSRFFGSDYYVDVNSNVFVKYKGVHGPPGTPETIITLIK